MTRYRQEVCNEDGWTDWVQPIKEGYKMACCDCGLVYEMDFRIKRGRVQFRVSRDNRATAAHRRERAKKEVTPDA